MSQEIVKSISIQDNKVFFTSVSSNVYPKEFERSEIKTFTNIYRKGGLEALLPHIAANVWEGNFKLYKGSKLCKYLLEGYENISSPVMLRNFLDSETAANYMAAWVLFRLEKGPEPDLSKLHALRQDKEAVLAICSKNHYAFNFAGEAVCKDREAAKAHILANGHNFQFQMPFHFRNDKELAKLALEHDGTIFRQLDPSIRDDRELIALAFDSTLSRRNYERYPDLIPYEIRKDSAFMAQVISKCPNMQLYRARELGENKDLVTALFNTRDWDPLILRNIPYRILKAPEIQNLIRTALQSRPDRLRIAEHILLDKGISLRKRSLDDQVASAEDKAPSGQTPNPEKSIEKAAQHSR